MTKLSITTLLPAPFTWCGVPAGQVALASASGRAIPFEVAAFDIAMYPITNAQFQAFVDAPDGYADPIWWAYSTRSQRWHERNLVWDAPFKGDDLPRAGVSWFEAVAFCRWLSAKTGDSILLTTEQEWQRAAQGDDGRLFPWGNAFDPKRCNTSDCGIKYPTSVTRYTDGASPFGVMDMCGNTAEWCLNAFNVPDDADIHSFEGGDARAMRGGSWGLSYHSATNVFRGSNQPADRFEFLGFRIARKHPVD